MLTDLRLGDCYDVLRSLPEASVDSIVTDPPYGLSFMGKRWDYDVPYIDVWFQCLRVLKPGGHLIAFAGTRTQHRMAVRIEDAGFDIRDMIAWVYGSGFPKSHNVAIAIDKMNGAPHRGKALVVAGRGERKDLQGKDANPKPQDLEEYAPATPEAQQWTGWGTALKPAMEPITVARKPLVGTVAANVLRHGTGALNVDGCRVGDASGRWPANLIHDGSEEPCALLGDAARFFYCAKASKADRGDGNNHPTVKPTDLMRYLCRLVTPPGGIVLDPFMGSGSTGKAALLEGFQFIGIEREQQYLDIARARIKAAADEAAKPRQKVLGEAP